MRIYFEPQAIALLSLKIGTYGPDVNEGFLKNNYTKSVFRGKTKKNQTIFLVFQRCSKWKTWWLYDELSLGYNPLSSITACSSYFNIQSSQLPFILMACRNHQMPLTTQGNPCPQSPSWFDLFVLYWNLGLHCEREGNLSPYHLNSCTTHIFLCPSFRSLEDWGYRVQCTVCISKAVALYIKTKSTHFSGFSD